MLHWPHLLCPTAYPPHRLDQQAWLRRLPCRSQLHRQHLHVVVPLSPAKELEQRQHAVGHGGAGVGAGVPKLKGSCALGVQQLLDLYTYESGGSSMSGVARGNSMRGVAT